MRIKLRIASPETMAWAKGLDFSWLVLPYYFYSGSFSDGQGVSRTSMIRSSSRCFS